MKVSDEYLHNVLKERWFLQRVNKGCLAIIISLTRTHVSSGISKWMMQ